MVKKIETSEGISWLVTHAQQFSRGLTTAFAEEFGVSRAAAATFVKKQVEAGFLVKEGSATQPVYDLGKRRRICHEYALPEVDESEIWMRDFMPYLPLSPNVAHICEHGFTEMVNNANDHSGGSVVNIIVDIRKALVHISILDDGMGIFSKISTALNLPDKRLALLELKKGKLTTDGANHSGEGIFFTSRAFDHFYIDADGLEFSHHDGHSFDRLEDPHLMTELGVGGGTGVYMCIALDSTRKLREVFNQFTSNPDEMAFDKTVIPVRLARLGEENLLSRSQAKRLLQRIDKFRYVELDFSEVAEIGQAFADEIFRVFAMKHPDIQLVPTHASEMVMKMIQRAKNTQV